MVIEKYRVGNMLMLRHYGEVRANFVFKQIITFLYVLFFFLNMCLFRQ